MTLGKTLGGVFAVTGAIEGLKKLAEGAAESESAFAILDRQLKNAHASSTLLGKGIQEVLEAEARLKGFSAESLASGFGRIVSATHDSAKAMKDLSLAEDIARARHIDVEIAANAMAKAERGNITSLLRLGVVVPKVTDAVDALKKQHDRLTESGVKFTKQMEDQYKAQLLTAEATDTATRKALGMQMVQEQFGGIATHSGKASAQMARFREILHQVSVQVGTALLPELGNAAEGLAKFAEKIRASGSAGEEAKKIMHGIVGLFHTWGEIAKVVGPPIGFIVKTLAHLIELVGAGPLVTFAASFYVMSKAARMFGGELGLVSKALKLVAIEEGIVLAINPFTAALVGAAALIASIVWIDKHIGKLLKGPDPKGMGQGEIEGPAGFSGIEHAAALKKAAAGNTDLANRNELLATYATIIGRIPSAKEVKIVTTASSAAEAAKALDKTLEKMPAAAKEHGFKTGQKFADSMLDSLMAHAKKFSAADATAKAGDAVTKNAGSKSMESMKVALAAIDQNIKDTKIKLAASTASLALAEQALADAIHSGHQQVHDSIESAMQNLASIGSTLAGTIEEFLQKVGGGEGVASPQSAAFKRLRDEIGSGHAAPGAARAASELANQIQEHQAVASQRGATAKRQIADLVAEFNKGSITLATFNKRIAGLLAKDGITYGKAGKALGVAFADGFRAQVQGLKDQAAAINATPRGLRAGLTGQEPSIVRPLETIHQVAQQIKAAQAARHVALLAVQKDQKHLTSLTATRALTISHQAAEGNRIARKSEAHLKKLAKDSSDRRKQEIRDAAQQRRDAKRLVGNPGDGNLGKPNPLEIHGIRPTPLGGL